MRQRVVVLTLLTLGLSCFAGTCRKASAPPLAPAEDRAPAPTEVPAESFPSAADRLGSGEPAAADATPDGALATVYFAFDRYDIDEENRRVLRENADRLRRDENLPILVEGHCDERGTIKYNLALGERRAEAVRQYLASLGVDASRIRIVSYGEERPAALGENEEVWSKNRRAEFKPEP